MKDVKISSNSDLAGRVVDKGDDSETMSDSSRSTYPLSTPLANEVDRLAQKKKFGKLTNLIAQSNVRDWLPEHEEGGWPSNFPTPLHLVLQYKTPVETLEMLIGICRDRFQIGIPEEFPDHLGRTPLHVSIASMSCTEEIVERLLKGESLVMPAIVRDSWQRTPLHWACQPIQGYKGHKLQMKQWYQKMVTQKLLEEYPECVLALDSEGKTPLDYAQEHNHMMLPSLEKKYLFYSRNQNEQEGEADDIPPHVPGEDQQSDDASTLCADGSGLW